MVCTFGMGRMKAMARLLTQKNYSEVTKDETRPDIVAGLSIYRMLDETDEANLLEEEDMHVFGCKPMTDPLHLVCCSTCKKPLKDSQFATHAERCYSFNFAEEKHLELDRSNTGHNKALRKGKKNLHTTDKNQAMSVSQHGTGYTNENGVGVSESNLDDQTGRASREAKSRPAPLATKMYYVQRSHQLRSALSQIYSDASIEEYSNDPFSQQLVHGNKVLPSLVPSPMNLSSKSELDGLSFNKMMFRSLNQSLASSDGNSSPMDFSNQFEDNFSRPTPSVKAASLGMPKNIFLPGTYSVPITSGFVGTSLGTRQQPNEIVPVL